MSSLTQFCMCVLVVRRQLGYANAKSFFGVPRIVFAHQPVINVRSHPSGVEQHVSSDMTHFFHIAHHWLSVIQ